MRAEHLLCARLSLGTGTAESDTGINACPGGGGTGETVSTPTHRCAALRGDGAVKDRGW